MSVLNQIGWSNDNTIDSLEPLDIIGFIEYLNDIESYTSYVVANSRCILFKMPIKDFAKLIQTNVTLCYKTLLVFAKVTQAHMDRAELHTLFHARDVVGHFLYQQAEKTDHFPFICSMTRSAMANRLHINLRTLYRYIDWMRENGFLDLKGGKILINREHFDKLKERYGDIVL